MTKEYFLTQILVSAIFYFTYYLLYRRSSNLHANRAYLLGTLLLSLLIPIVHFDVFPYYVENQFIKSKMLGNTLQNNGTQKEFDYLKFIYFSGVAVQSMFFILNIGKLLKAIREAKFINEDGKKIAFVEGESFSFLNYLFIEKNNEIIKKHELGHAHYFHSIDRIIVAIITVFYWFNPFVYLYKKRMEENHEYLADDFTITKLKISKTNYAEILYDYAFKRSQAPPISNKFSTQIKNRLTMLAQEKNSNKSYLILVPILFATLVGFTFKKYPVEYRKGINNYATKKDSLRDSIEVIDTIETYNSETKEVKIMFAKSKQPKNPVSFNNIVAEINKIKFSGKMKTVVDTTEMFDPTTYESKITISSIDLPVEIMEIINRKGQNHYLFKYAEIMSLYGKYGRNKKDTKP